MAQASPPGGLRCPTCSTPLEALEERAEDAHRLICPHCRETFLARPRVGANGTNGKAPLPRESPPEPTLSGLGLWVRGFWLRIIPPIYRAGVILGAVVLLLVGGFVPVGNGWLHDRITSWRGVVARLGGIWVAPRSRNPDADLGLVLGRLDAPALFEMVSDVSRRLGIKPPEEIRLAFLPCCGLLAWERGRALLVGMPLLPVLTLSELRAVLAHELAHLAKGDATWAAKSIRFVESLGFAIEDAGPGGLWGPLGAWAEFCHRIASGLVVPIARGQEARADRSAGSISGGSVAVSALVKVAVVQPLFREVLDNHDPDDMPEDAPNFYEFFRAFWNRLPDSLLLALRVAAMTQESADHDASHPPLSERLAAIYAFPDPAEPSSEMMAATNVLGDLDYLEQVLHDRLFEVVRLDHCVFHRAGR